MGPASLTQEDVDSMRQQLAALEAEQDRLAEAEMFDEAEALEETVQQLKDALARGEEQVAASPSTAEGQCSGEEASTGFAFVAAAPEDNAAAPEDNDTTPPEDETQEES